MPITMNPKTPRVRPVCSAGRYAVSLFDHREFLVRGGQASLDPADGLDM